MVATPPHDPLAGLNPAQRAAATHAPGGAPLLVIAGAGSGKTKTLAHRVAHLILGGADPRRILLLTFTRRAAAEMTRRARSIVGTVRGGRGAGELPWSGTFHAVANRLLRLHAAAVGLDPSFTVLDRSDAADLMNLVRADLGLGGRSRRFPKKRTCLSIYSRAASGGRPLEDLLRDAFPWCAEWDQDLRALFRGYVDAKQKRQILDYDDLLLYWYHLMAEPALAAAIGERFDHVLVDEYQDTNPVQAGILTALKPDGRGVTVVGDDAQAIYSFRAATVDNILGFADQFPTPARVVTLEANYRSTQPILDAANAAIALSPVGYRKRLASAAGAGPRPTLATVEDETAQVEYVVERVLAAREEGAELKHQSVLFRASHHSDALEVELSRRNIPYVKYGGLKFLEAAHVKDVLSVLRWAENPRDEVAALRVLQLLPGIGPAGAGRAIEHVRGGASGLADLATFKPPPAAATAWPGLCRLLADLGDPERPWVGQLGRVRQWYEPILEQRHDAAHARLGDIEELERLADEHPSRDRFLTELTLDPPDASGDLAGPPVLDEDYLVLSTIHSAKGQEWDTVFVLNVVDGCIPSDMSTGKPELVEEERRLLYVAMTRARRELHLVHPLRFYVHHQRRGGDRHVYAPRSRFVPDEVAALFERVSVVRGGGVDSPAGAVAGARVDVAAKLRDMW